MRYNQLGRTGLYVSELCLGTMTFGGKGFFEYMGGLKQDAVDQLMKAAFDAGINFVDTAAMYADGLTEEILGRIMKGGRRDKLFLTTKVHKGVDRASIVSSIDESLKRMQTDHVDLYLIHWPVEGMKPTEIMEALNTVVESGKTRYVGCCNYPAWLLAHHNAIAAANGWARMVNNQVAYNIIERGVEVGRCAAEHALSGQSAGNRQIAAQSVAGAAKHEHVARIDAQRTPRRNGGVADARVERRAGQGDHGIALEAQRWTGRGEFDRGRTFVVADERVGETQRYLVHRAARADAERGDAVASAILQGVEQASFDYDYTHAISRASSASNSSAAIARNCTRSPGASRAGGSA